MDEQTTTEDLKDKITLKWGTLKAWTLNTPKCREIFKKYLDAGAKTSAMSRDTQEQKEIICELIDVANLDTVYLYWDDKHVSKEEAKEYVRNYK